MPRKISMPFDDHGQPVQGALFPSSGEVVKIEVGANRSATAIVSQVVRLLATSDCHIRFGSSTVVALATDMLLQKDHVEYFNLRLHPYISVIRDTADGNLYITIME